MPKGYWKDGKPIQPPSTKGMKWKHRKPVSAEVRKLRRKNALRLGLIPPNHKGKKFSDERNRKLSETNKGKPHPNQRGDKNGRWSGGLNTLRYKEKLAGRPRPEQCEVCGAFGTDTKKGLCFDHCHITGKFRGWICQRCNTALGFVKDNTETLQSLINYLLKSRE